METETGWARARPVFHFRNVVNAPAAMPLEPLFANGAAVAFDAVGHRLNGRVGGKATCNHRQKNQAQKHAAQKTRISMNSRIHYLPHL